MSRTMVVRQRETEVDTRLRQADHGCRSLRDSGRPIYRTGSITVCVYLPGALLLSVPDIHTKYFSMTHSCGEMCVSAFHSDAHSVAPSTPRTLHLSSAVRPSSSPHSRRLRCDRVVASRASHSSTYDHRRSLCTAPLSICLHFTLTVR